MKKHVIENLKHTHKSKLSTKPILLGIVKGPKGVTVTRFPRFSGWSWEGDGQPRTPGAGHRGLPTETFSSRNAHSPHPEQPSGLRCSQSGIEPRNLNSYLGFSLWASKVRLVCPALATGCTGRVLGSSACNSLGKARDRRGANNP